MYEISAQPVYVALVDLSCNEEFLELAKSALLAAIEKLPICARFALITFSSKVPSFPSQLLASSSRSGPEPDSL